MEISEIRDTRFKTAKKAVENILKKEFDAQQESGYQGLFYEVWRENCVTKLLAPIEEIKKLLFLHRQVAQKDGESRETTNSTLKEDLLGILKSCVIGCWMKIRRGKGIGNQTKLAHQLIYLASDYRILGDYAFKTKLQYFTDRITVVKIGREDDLGLDNAIRLRDYCIFERLKEFNKKYGEDKLQRNKEKELEYAATFGIILLWEGIGYEHIKNLLRVSFDCSGNRNIVYLGIGNTYLICTISRDAWAILSRLAKSMPEIFRNTSIKNAKTLSEIYPNVIRRMQGIMTEGGEELLLPKELCKIEQFRQMGVCYKLVAYNCKPAYLSDITTSERSRNVLSPGNVYEDYEHLNARSKRRLKTWVSKVDSKADEEDGSVIYLDEYFADNKENVDKCLCMISEFAQQRDRGKTLSELNKCLENQPDSRIMLFTKHLMETRSQNGKRLDPATVFMYLRSIAEIFVFRIIHQAEKIYSDELIASVIGCEMEDGKPLINRNTFNGLKSAYWNYEKCLEKRGIKMPGVKWVKLRKYCDKSNRLIVIPPGKRVEALIKELLGSDDEYIFDLGMILALEYYCGLRSKEAYSFECVRLRCVGEGEYYIEVTGKFSKERRVDLSYLPYEYRELLVWMVENVISNGKTELFGLSNRGKYKYRFNKLCRDVVPSGMHSIRHAFAVRKLIEGMDPRKIASMLGHETLRVLHNTYDQSAYYVMKEQMQSRYWEREYISKDEAMGLLRLSETGFKKYVARHGIVPVHKENANRKGGEKVNYYSYRQIIDLCFDGMAHRTSQISMRSREVQIWKWDGCSPTKKRLSA